MQKAINMHLIYAIINFALLVLLLWFFGRKAVRKVVSGRVERIGRELADMEQGFETQRELEGQLVQAQAEHEAALAKIAQESGQLIAQKQRELDASFLSAEQQRRDKAQSSIHSSRRSMLRDVMAKVSRSVMSQAPGSLRVPADYQQRMLEKIIAKLTPTRADLVYLETRETLPVALKTALPADEELISRVVTALREKYPQAKWPEGWRPRLKTDASIIGGLVLRVNDTRYDGSIRNILDGLDADVQARTPSPEDNLETLTAAWRQIIENKAIDVSVYQIGEVTSLSDGICIVSGLSDALYGELLLFPGNVKGMVMNLEKDRIGSVVFGEFEKISVGDQVRRTGHVVEVPVGSQLLGRVVDGLGQPMDGQGDIYYEALRPIECSAPSIIQRKSVSVPLYTGTKAVDALVPIGRGQRELIIGDRQTGKTALAVDAIINQRDKDVLCIYVAIGQKETTVAGITDVLRRMGALDYTIIVSANAYSSAPMQYVAPYTATAMAEHFMYQGRDVLIVYDDLSKHAVAYRELSLLLQRPSGREAYPGDVFYLHSRLLERSARLTGEAGGGSITALPIIETQDGDISAYIPTNAISITDGQIFLESSLFNEGQRPAVNIGLSVSRVGGSAQSGPMRQVAGRLRMDLAQYRELASFSQFGSDLDQATKDALKRGDHMTAALRQDQYHPLAIGLQVLILQAVTMGFTADMGPEAIPAFEEALGSAFSHDYPRMLERLSQPEKLSKEELAFLCDAIGDVKGRLA